MRFARCYPTKFSPNHTQSILSFLKSYRITKIDEETTILTSLLKGTSPIAIFFSETFKVGELF